jgi:hypothetical protein
LSEPQITIEYHDNQESVMKICRNSRGYVT